MQRILPIVIVSWSFVLGPVLCVAGWLDAECQCEFACEAGDHGCGEGHGCHDDPCQVDATVTRLKAQLEGPSRPASTGPEYILPAGAGSEATAFAISSSDWSYRLGLQTPPAQHYLPLLI